MNATEANRWWAVPEFREYRSLRKFRTNQFDPWPDDDDLVQEFEGSVLGDRWRARLAREENE